MPFPQIRKRLQPPNNAEAQRTPRSRHKRYDYREKSANKISRVKNTRKTLFKAHFKTILEYQAFIYLNCKTVKRWKCKFSTKATSLSTKFSFTLIAP
jgi:hypothetical protein